MVNMEWVKEQARPGGFDDAAPVKKLEGHAFCTGHTYMGGTNAIFFAAAADRELSSAYAQVHGMSSLTPTLTRTRTRTRTLTLG